jgi:hypothetical protein
MKRLTLRFYEEKDQDLLIWLDGLRPGAQSDSLKDILRIGLAAAKGGQQPAASTAPVDTAALVDAIADRFLPYMRQILDASLTSHLAELVVAGRGNGGDQMPKEDIRITDALNALSSGLSIDDDEEP